MSHWQVLKKNQYIVLGPNLVWSDHSFLSTTNLYLQNFNLELLQNHFKSSNFKYMMGWDVPQVISVILYEFNTE